ncbi:MAG: acetyl-CoA carboxylase biotin carboxylase subunit [Deltaproteobacteria bacterium]|nr:acetyl-CoA carboxylase biotin carboxylase subunit [Deltaproteobacteria bacterium]
MIRKVLIANRGEIAVRVARTLREMRIASVAVYSDADARALHVRSCDESVRIGPPPPRESYLDIQRILDAASRSSADAIHPGYGFLSENPELAEACESKGIAFIGPRAPAMRAMGEKTAARARMRQAGVPVVPGTEAGDLESLRRAAEQIGYPVMLKAAAGGGGKGMRLVACAAELDAAYERARSESRKAFGDDRVYLEKAIVSPRHVEIQVLADAHGGAVHLFERDCSIQRRHQKVLEETPSPAPAATGARVAEMGEVAVRAARAVDYVGAGTVEFLMDPAGSYWFLEMNTRLQVEHPITELVTGVDIVREQVRIAAGEPLGYGQESLQRRGAAIECRIYAEDPAHDFLPSPARIERLRPPGGPGVRDDSGIYEGFDVPMEYDPLLSKLSVWAQDRPRALARMRRALQEYVLLGPVTNLELHRRLVDHPQILEGSYDTGFIAKNRAALTEPLPRLDALTALGAAVACARRGNGAGGSRESATSRPAASPWRMAGRLRSLGRR